ncbi:hypothetical protein RI129_002373 [Pyrocoelia pectoralis]|uniref:Uncharacterized protein n=1 Tax=Pyrocoelia pectoralis TaxID=417401 RepID=A0AAN7ZSZ2_9COLE
MLLLYMLMCCSFSILLQREWCVMGQNVLKTGHKKISRMFQIPDWPHDRPFWTEESLNSLLENAENVDEAPISLESIIESSNEFPIAFPIDSVRCSTLNRTIPKQALEKYINSAYPVIHENALPLLTSLLHHKRRFGNAREREFYQNMTVVELVDRLLSKRAVTFLNAHDNYLLIDGTKGFGKWEKIGTEAETEKLNLENCISYDEIKLSALLSVSSRTHFINNGNRYNEGVTKRINIENDGVIIGLIGTRFERPKVMEYAEIVITETQNTHGNGYGNPFVPTLRTIFSGFYGEPCLVYEDAVSLKKDNPTRFKELDDGILFDNNVYSKRLALSMDTLLFEANQRAKNQKTTAFVHVVGLGLGVWKISPHQNSLFLDTFAKRIISLGKHLHAISDIVFAYFGSNLTCGGYKSGDTIPIPGHPRSGIKVILSNREPHTKLAGEDAGKLLVVSYAWDGNALPGNEFWLGSLSGSGDPAAACSTQIAELHNPHINSKVAGNNLRIAGTFGVIPFSKYRSVAQLIN